MASCSEKQFSMHVSRTLDYLGKSQDMIKYRVKMFGERYYRNTTIVTGSKGEGLTARHESDHDLMIVIPEVICADNTQPFRHTIQTTLFQTERQDTPPGYTKLKLVKLKGKPFRSLIKKSLFKDASRDRYISSDIFTAMLANDYGQLNISNRCSFYERRGPSIPFLNKECNTYYDTVFAFCCVCPYILQAFINRHRLYDRPARNILNDISTLESHVVPVGFNGSDTSNQQWRICFTKAEMHLVHSFNDTETKLYILLKMVSKILSKISKDITSYIMKNVVLWLAELYPVVMFKEELLTTRLIQALHFLKKCVEVNYLPSYMIPERNLLAGQLNQFQRRKLTIALYTLIHEGGCLLLRCDKLQIAMSTLYRDPNMAEESGRWRDMVEKLNMVKVNLRREQLKINTCKTGCNDEREKLWLLGDDIYRNIMFLSIIVTIPELKEMMQLGCFQL